MLGARKNHCQEVRHIEIVLQHDYLQIKDTIDGVERTNTQLPIKTAKLIADLYAASGDTYKDPEEYAVGSGGYRTSNPSYTISVYNRHVEQDNELWWLTKFIAPYKPV